MKLYGEIGLTKFEKKYQPRSNVVKTGNRNMASDFQGILNKRKN
jgi:hypothetical protein